MINNTDRIFLDFSARKLELLTGRIESCLDRLLTRAAPLFGASRPEKIGGVCRSGPLASGRCRDSLPV
jgi:hypothetical protein